MRPPPPRTLQHEEAHHAVQVDVLVLALQEGGALGEAPQHVVNHLRPRAAEARRRQERRQGGQPQFRRLHACSSPRRHLNASLTARRGRGVTVTS